MTQDERKVIIERLRELQHIKVGDPMPVWLNGPGAPAWLTIKVLTQLAGDAADLIDIYDRQARLDAAMIASYKADAACQKPT